MTSPDRLTTSTTPFRASTPRHIPGPPHGALVADHAALRELVRAFIVTHAGHCDQCDAYATQIADGCCYACDTHTGWCGAGCGAEPHARPCPAWTDLPHAALIRAVMPTPTLPSRPR